MSRSEVPFAEVVEAVRAEIAEAKPNGWQVAYGLICRIGDRVQFDVTAEPRAYLRNAAENKFAGQVSRAFNKLAEQGVLRKAAEGKPGPDGREVNRHQVAYYTPAMWDAIAEEAAGHRAAEKALEARWTAIGDRLGALGLPRPVHPGRTPLLGHEEWERLLELAELGKGMRGMGSTLKDARLL